MGLIEDAIADLAEGLKEVPKARVHTDLGKPVDPPGLVIGPPALTWEGYCSDPTAAVFMVYFVVAADDRSMAALYAGIPVVAAAIDGVENAVLARAMPGAWQGGGTELPAYLFEVNYTFSGG